MHKPEQHATPPAAESEGINAKILSASPDAVAISRVSDGKLIRVNTAFERQVGLPEHELVGKTTLELGLWKDPAQRAEFSARLRRDGCVRDFEVAIRTPLGERTIAISAEVTRIDGELCMCSFGRDITEYKLAQAAIEHSERRYRNLFDSALDGIVVLSGGGEVLDVNASACAMLGVDRAAVIGQKFTAFFAGERASAIEACYAEVFAQGNALGEHELRSPRGVTARVEFHAGMLPDGNLQAILRDVTERGRAEAEIRELNASLAQRVRERTAELEVVNQELEGFAYTVSHDLRAPLRAIAGLAGILRTEHAARLGEDGTGLLSRIESCGERMTALIDDLLEFAKAKSAALTPAPVNMRGLVGEVLDDLGAGGVLPAEIVLCDLPEARGDASLIRQIWQNLIANAIKFSRNAQHPRIEIGSMPGACAGTTYYVRDNGCGFDMVHAKKLFGMFQRLHSEREYEGTGIGLAIAARIVRRHGGHIRARGEPGQGATFCFRLPE